MRVWIGVIATIGVACGDPKLVEDESDLTRADLGQRIEQVLELTGVPADGEIVYYDAGCVECHRASGLGEDDPDEPGIGANLMEEIAEDEDRELVRAILVGPEEMPSFADVLSDQEIADVLAYVTEDLFE